MRHWHGLQIRAEGSGITRQLSELINLLGELLGHVIRVQAGDEIFRLIEELRNRCKLANQPGNDAVYQQLQEKIHSLSQEQILWIIRGYTVFFHLANEAERQEIIRINQERQFQASTEQPRTGSVMEAVHNLKRRGCSADQLLDLIRQLDIQPTLTAHPTEARRRSILYKQKRIAQLMTQLRAQRVLSAEDRDDLITRIYHQISLLMATDDVRSERLTVEDEIKNGLYFTMTSIWDVVPRIYYDLEDAIEVYFDERPSVPAFLKYHSWIGGDRDGNPFVTVDVTRSALRSYRHAALQGYIEELAGLKRELSLSSRRVDIPDSLLASVEKDAQSIRLCDDLMRNYKTEPFRLKISYMLSKMKRLLSRSAVTPDFYTPDDFLSDLKLIRANLRQIHLEDIAPYKRVSDLIIRAQVFGFHLVALDIRQHSEVHQHAVTELLNLAGVTDDYAALTEDAKLAVLETELQNPRPLLPRHALISEMTTNVLETMNVVREAQANNPESIGGYVVSMTHSASNILEVLLLAKETSLWQFQTGEVSSKLNIVPLFETIEDFERVEQLIEKLFSLPTYRAHLKAHADFQEIMLGYSDSNKDGGYWMANWILREGQQRIARLCRRHGITFRFFHGRGGTVARGGGRAAQAILAMPRESQNGRLRFTEQGEVISFRYAQPAIARRHLEEILNAVLQTSCQNEPAEDVEPTMKQLMEKIALDANYTYRQLIDAPQFWEWFVQSTPIKQIGRLPLASRPVSRKSPNELNFENLRVIPWVFAWIQTRYNIPGWYGIGHALQTAIHAGAENLSLLQRMYQQWTFFCTVLNNAQQAMARTKLNIAALYGKSQDQQFHEQIVTDFKKAEQAILAITGQKQLLDNNPVIQKSIQLRNPYTDVLNLLQIELLQRQGKAGKEGDAELRQALFLSINGIAAAMQSTG
ncbi:phosphoenolpyruvate carboxylase [candidate division KSB1 bacterium]|nr:phosphoenolpyruvate carboxylase [candidate division KSB1 bacterium]